MDDLAAAAFRARVEDAVERDDPAELADLALEVGLEAEPWEWAQSCCVQLARHRSAGVRASAIASFGHLARRFGRLDPGRVRRMVEIAMFDPSAVVRERAADAADDLYTFLGWEFESRPEAARSEPKASEVRTGEPSGGRRGGAG